MIYIQNMGPRTEDPGGERNYEVRINAKVICKFKHARKDGLAVCLKKAATAVEEAERK